MNSRIRDVVAGLGFRRGACAEDLVRLVWVALDLADIERMRLRALATSDRRATDPAFQAAATALRVVTFGPPPSALQAVDSKLTTRSARIQATHGVGSVAEAAALAAAGEHAVLILARIQNAAGTVTCALALVPETP